MQHARVIVGKDGTPGQGPHLVIVLELCNDCVSQARFSTYGCPVAVACGQFVCDQIEGKPLSEASKMEEADIIRGIGQMPLGRDHCPGLAIRALRDALMNVNEDVTAR